MELTGMNSPIWLRSVLYRYRYRLCFVSVSVSPLFCIDIGIASVLYRYWYLFFLKYSNSSFCIQGASTLAKVGQVISVSLIPEYKRWLRLCFAQIFKFPCFVFRGRPPSPKLANISHWIIPLNAPSIST